ncbi:ATP-binding protein [Pseudomonas lini]|uniref:Endonuclease GajA/Old nuclease/RecF-like AAA domain-containing protein n=1 Tax=Pseudomonas lini TaxID=163011 RepID=A0A423IM93_9PSED|nr:ATP-binding protein [Pseudomonas lini]RON26568.1 hypothetical protein BK663_14455 [Pseudomonas lini]
MNDNIFSYNGIPLIIPEEYDERTNSFTILVGNNGVGKSRLLSSLSNSLIEHTNPSFGIEYESIYDSGYLSTLPKVIAVSTSPFDAFKLPRTGERRGAIKSNYRYIGMRGPGQFSTGSISLISSAASGLLEKLKTKHGFDRLDNVFKVLGFDPTLEFIFKPMFKERWGDADHTPTFVDDLLFEDGSKIYNIQDRLGITIDPKLHNTVADLPEFAIEEISEALDLFSTFYLERSHFILTVFRDYSWEYQFNNHYHNNSNLLTATRLLLNYGLVRLMDLKLSKPSNRDLSMRRASSGEQCMLVIMLGIAGHITDHSKIFIDEPEISLHPQWQEKFMSLLIEVFSSYRGCNFFIATHSPQIISKLNAHNCFVTSLTKRSIFSASEFRERSADFQLAEIFDAPGTMNEYLIRIAFKLMSKLKTTKSLSSDDIVNLEKLLYFGDKLDPHDPLLQLITSVFEMSEHYAAD